MSGSRLAIALATLLFGTHCATVEEVEGTQVPGNEGPAEYEGRQALDSELCWESIQQQSDSAEDADAAHARCMRAKGWGEEP